MINLQNAAIRYYTTDFKSLTKEQQLYVLSKEIVDQYINNNWYQTKKNSQKQKQVFYFSLEFLIGQQLEANILNLGIKQEVEEQLAKYGLTFDELKNIEPDPALGNGGLGRLAACFMDSLASLGYPGHGMGLRYEYGLFQQKITNGYQQEQPDNWLKTPSPWEKRNEKEVYPILIGGKLNPQTKQVENGLKFQAVAYEIPMVGYQNAVVNNLMLWKAEPLSIEQTFDFQKFNEAKYIEAVTPAIKIETINKLLYPEDSSLEGKKLRLMQQFTMSSAGVQSIIKNHLNNNYSIEDLAKYVVIQLNDTHPAIVVAELMRILIDEYNLSFEQSFAITQNTVNYTNHTILPEAIEKWWIELIKELLPRQYSIIEQLDQNYVNEQQNNLTEKQLFNTRIIQNDLVNMANLAIIASTHVNGVAALHTSILKKQTFKDFHQIYPTKINNFTNGIAHRRWLYVANPQLTNLISQKLGNENWKTNIVKDLKQFEAFKNDPSTIAEVLKIKDEHKKSLAKLIEKEYAISVDPTSIFDTQIKRFHAYKRQLLNALQLLNEYNQIKKDPNYHVVKRTYIFGGKAAPGYVLAKNIIKLITSIADLINNDPVVSQKIKVVFIENYRISIAEKLFAATDVSEQISTASKEASGTGNMKFMMNGALTLGTLDGANVEIANAVEKNEIVIFGKTSEEIIDLENNGGYCSQTKINEDERLQLIFKQLQDQTLSPNKNEFAAIIEDLIEKNDPYFVLLDFDSYCKAQKEVEAKYTNREDWGKMMISNIANSGIFSSDRTIMEYAKENWNIEKLKQQK